MGFHRVPFSDLDYFLYMSTISAMLYLVHLLNFFADDTNLFIFGDSVYSVEREAVDFVYTLNEWFISNKLSLNLLKTCYMNFFVDSAAKNNLDVEWADY